MIGGFIPGSQPGQLTKKCRDIFYGGTNYCCMIGGFIPGSQPGQLTKNAEIFFMGEQIIAACLAVLFPAHSRGN